MSRLPSATASPPPPRDTARRVRRLLVFLHRWTGLLTAAFLILVGVTGSLLAFDTDLDRLINPQLFANARPGERPLDLATLAILAEQQEPRARVAYFKIDASVPDRVTVAMRPRTDPITGKPFELAFNHVFLNPFTGAELGRRADGDLSQGRINVVPFLYRLHTSLALGDAGTLTLGIVALAWTIDCAVGFYLTLPLGLARFLSHWKPAWLVKGRASTFRTHFDLHRASGLWLWPLLFVFAWSSVMFNLPSVYDGVTDALLSRTPFDKAVSTLQPPHPTDRPRLDWREAEQRGRLLVAAESKRYGIRVLRPFGLGYIPSLGVYTYDVRTDRDVGGRTWETGVWIDGNTGTLQKLFSPIGTPPGDTVTTWLYALHWADFHDWLVYRAIVAALGVMIVMLSVTGVYIWFRKSRARKITRLRLSLQPKTRSVLK